MKKQIALTVILTASLLFTAFAQEQKKKVKMTDLPYIELTDFNLYWGCAPWRDDKVVTLDGLGRWATIEFYKTKDGTDKARFVSLCDFPRYTVSSDIESHPDSGWLLVWSSKMLHAYNADTGRSNSFVPIASWKGFVGNIFPMSTDDLLCQFYWSDLEDIKCIFYFTYNNRTKIIDRSHSELTEVFVWKQLRKYGKTFLASECLDLEKDIQKFFFYDWDKKEKTENELTKEMSKHLYKTYHKNIHINMEKRILVSTSVLLDNGTILMMWNKEYADIKIIPFKLIEPKNTYSDIQSVSGDCEWILVHICGYKGIYGEFLNRYAFVRISNEYPGMLSPLVFVEGFWKYREWKHCSFFKHPEYGDCFIATYTELPSLKKHTRLYKMSDVQEKIDRILLEKAKSVVK